MKTADDLLQEIFNEVGTRATDEFVDQYTRWAERCQSPIESVMAAALLSEKIEGVDFFCKPGPAAVPFRELYMGCSSLATEYLVAGYAQFIIGSYRADFYLEAFDRDSTKRWYRTIIECDGHDFHERTKTQAAHDKKRDRWFQEQGISVLRFTGSEIWKDPIHCADQVYENFYAAARREYAGRWGLRA